MKSRRIFMVSVLVVIMMSMTSVLSAMELERGTMTDLKQIEKSDMISVAKHIVTIYEDEKNQSEGYYTVWDKKGKEITDQFKKDVQEYAKKRDYENIITYFVNDISIIEKTTQHGNASNMKHGMNFTLSA